MEEQFLEIDTKLSSVVRALFGRYPSFTPVEELAPEAKDVHLDDRMRVAQDLWEKKLIVTKEPLESHYDD